MRITKVSVKGLFGYLDHEIPLNQESRITIIHGPNGVGKTILMRMLHGLFHYDYEYIGSVPFEQFRIEFEGGTALTVEKESTVIEDDEVKESALRIKYIDASGKLHDPYTPSIIEDRVLDEHVKKLLPELRSVEFLSGKRYWIMPPNEEEQKQKQREISDESTWIELLFFALGGRVLSREDILREYPALHNEIIGPSSVWYANIQKEASPKLVSIDRLKHDFEVSGLLGAWGAQLARERGVTSTKFPDDLIFPGPIDAVNEIMSDGRRVSNFYSVFERSESLAEYKAEIEELENVLSKDAVLNNEFATELLKEDLSLLSDRAREISEDPDYRKARLFCDILDERLLFKSLGYNTGLEIRSKDGNPIPFSKLSSGEQQLLILYYQLLFEIEPDTLVMIDEPEISMNVVWQRNFLKDLQRIVELREFDVLVATHSPQIIHDKWDWMVPLGEKADD